MSFFFAKAKREPKPVKAGPARAAKVSAKTKQSADILNRLGCKVCPLAKLGDQVPPIIPKKTDVLFLGDRPTRVDAEKGKPFTGKVGKIIRELIPNRYETRTGFTNVVLHQTPKDAEPDFVATESCRNHIIAQIEEAAPKLIIGLGFAPLKWVLNNADMTGLRGRFFTVKIGKHVCYFMPTFDVNYVLKFAQNKDRPFQSKFGGAFKMDIERAFNFLGNYRKPFAVSPVEAKQHVEIFYKGADLDGLLEHFKLANKAKKIAIDLETYPLRPYSKDAVLLTAAVSYYLKNGKQKTFAFAVRHPKAQWSPSNLTIVLEELEGLLANPKVVKIAHNAPFELEWLMSEFGTDFVQHDLWEDTMMQAHLLDERKGNGREDDRRPTYQNLDFLCNQYFGLKIKSLFKLNKKDMRQTDIEECLVYNGVDSKYTLILHDVQEGLLNDESLLKTFDFIKGRSATVALMQRIGVDVAQKVSKGFQKKLDKEVKGIEDSIQEMKVVKQYVKDHGEFNPHSGPQVLTVFKDYLKREEIKVPKKLDENEFDYKVDKNVLDKIDHPLAPAIIKLRNRQKLKATYVDEFVMGTGTLIYPDGKLHTSYNTTFTTSGRLSSEDPNLQNFPKREDKWVRAQIVPPPGFKLLAIDYGQLEWCLACMCCKDKVMIEATWNEYDVHMEWTKKIAKRWPKLVGGKKFLDDMGALKKGRGLVKNKMVFPAIFGARQESIAGYLNMPDDVAHDIFTEFWNTFKGLHSWQQKLMKGYYEEGYVENFFGRRRRYPMTRNEAINFPIQSSASEIVVHAMERLSVRSLDTDTPWMHPVLNIHDDLTFCVPDDDDIIDEAIMEITTEMLALPYSFVNVPMSVEVSLGTNWENLEDLVKVWTTDTGRHTDKDKLKYIGGKR